MCIRDSLSSADDADSFVDIQQDGSKTLQQVQPLFLAVQVVVGAAAVSYTHLLSVRLP